MRTRTHVCVWVIVLEREAKSGVYFLSILKFELYLSFFPSVFIVTKSHTRRELDIYRGKIYVPSLCLYNQPNIYGQFVQLLKLFLINHWPPMLTGRSNIMNISYWQLLMHYVILMDLPDFFLSSLERQSIW